MTDGGHHVGSLLLLLALVVFTSAQSVSIIAPNTFRLGAEETVGVISATQVPEEVKLYLQDFPGRRNKFSEIVVKASHGNPQIARLRVDPDKIPDLTLATAKDKHYVLLVAEGKKFRKEAKVIVGIHSGYMFIQTDKPIYTPRQTVHVRIISLDQDMLTENKNFTVQIRNPQNVIVHNIPSSNLDQKHGLYTYNFEFPPTALEGEWSVVAKFGHKIPRNETVPFELKHYSLPTYEVKLKMPEVILPVDDVIEVDVEAKYVYGKIVEGTVSCKFGVMSETKKTIYVGKTIIKTLQGGKAKCRIDRITFEEHKEVGWFDTISGSRLVVDAQVTERATGEQETVSSSNTLFSKTRYLVDFTRSLHDFKPGFTAAIQADIKEATGKKAPGVLARVEVKDDKGALITPENNQWEDMSDENGKVAFFIPTRHSIQKLRISVFTKDPELDDKLQGVRRHEMNAIISTNFVSLDRTTISNTLVVGNDFTSNVYSSPTNMPISFAVTANGRVVKLGTLAMGDIKQRTVHVKVTDEMIPSFRITLFAVNQGQTLMDSVKIDVKDECRAQAKIKLETTLTNAEPGKEGTITVKGTSETVVGMLAVDKAVYVLRNKGLLTKDKMFSKMEEHDLGCGPGGGKDTQSILANAGLIFLSDTAMNAPDRPSCTERRLNKRAIRDEVLNQEDETLHKCCTLGMYGDLLHRSCEDRVKILDRYHTDDTCAKVFLRCCQSTVHLYTPKALASNGPMAAPAGPAAVGRSKDEDDEELHFVPESEEMDHEAKARERNDFRETMVFETGVIGGDNRWELPLNLPHSITTWVIQAVGISPRQGMCVADPIEAVAFQNVFIQLKLPYSVVRNEQIELRATIFNYGSKRLPVWVSMYGVEGMCSEAQPNEKGERKKVWLNGNGGAETVGFPVVPLETGNFPIKIVAISPRGDDKIVQMLNVVAEGIPHEENIQIEIDPANLDKRKKRNIVSEKYRTRIDEEKKHQFSVVKLLPDQQYIPGTETCHITAIGEKFGPTVHTALNDPDKLIKMPHGCGEQTMAFMAPTLYTLHYLKVTGKLNAQQEANGYKFIREGYSRELGFRKPDGSYAAWIQRPSSTWLTAFVAKVFCQSSKYVFIDENTICSALDWLAKNQNPDGSFVDNNPIIHSEMTGGIKGAIPLTAFVLNALYKCDCNQVDTINAKAKAVEYLINQLPTITNPYYLAITAYALSLADPSEAGYNANQLLLARTTVDEELNYRYWGQAGTALSVEATSFALLTQLIHNNLDVAGSIVNWLNTQRTGSGSFWSTQDTVIALEALAQYAILARDDEMSLSCNLTSSSDVQFHQVIDFTPANARVLRSYELKKLGGSLHLEAQGTGVSHLNVQLKYNVPKKLDEICKFDINITVTDAKEDVKPRRSEKNLNQFFNNFDEDMLDELALGEPPRNKSVPIMLQLPGQIWQNGDQSRVLNMMDIPQDIVDLVRQGRPGRRLKRAPADGVLSNSKYVANITVCVQYLSHQDSNMAIADVGIFTGFQVDKKDLGRIVDDPTLPVARYEMAGRSVVFYLDKIGHQGKTCFWFRVVREFIVSHMESSIVRVYDYYNPGHACSAFFSPNLHNAVIQTVCTEKVCRCAEGGCPPKQPFLSIMQEPDSLKQRSALLEIACDKEYFVWKVEIDDVKSDASSFQTVEVRVLRVLREGRESRDDVLASPHRQFLGRKTCDSGELTRGKTYMIIGTDNDPIQQEDGLLKYLYYINKQTYIYEWINIFDRKTTKTKSKEQKNLQKVFNWMENQFINNDGCMH